VVNILRGFRNFLLRGDVIVIAIGLIVATAFSNLVKSFTSDVITPIITRIQGTTGLGFGIQLGNKGNPATFINLGDFVSVIVYFFVFMAVIYFLLVQPYKAVQARRGVTVFGDPTPAKTCPYCLADDLPVAAKRCKYCTSELQGVPDTSP
jgi:large conductance mechanosensitive channel